MPPLPPYTYFSCPCVDISKTLSNGNLASDDPREDDEEQDPTFSPHSPRSAYSLYPLDHLLYCEDCHEIRCPKCVVDEIVTWYCPSCLFEVASSLIKSDGNRCTRSCYTCPICVAPLAVNSLPGGHDGAAQEGSYILSCPYCNWSSTELGIRFHKPNDITGQLSNLKKSENTRGGDADPQHDAERGSSSMDCEQQFKNLKQFYSSQQAAEASASTTSGLDLASAYGSYSSPGSLSRIMSLYTGVGSYSATGGRGKSRKKIRPVREAYGEEEGVRVLADEEDEVVQKMKEVGWDGVTSQSQRTDVNTHARFLSDVQPVPTLLRTKRAKRCRTCRHILVKPESKVQSTRFRIRLVAMNYIPRLTISPLPPASTSTSTPFTPPVPSPLPPSLSQLIALHASQPTQFLLSFTNPLFTPLTITLATPPFTSLGTKTTILTPQFSVGASKDVWDEALSTSTSATASDDRRRTKAGTSSSGGEGSEGGPWAQGRNWTAIVVEVVPGAKEAVGGSLEIPVLVRVGHEAELGGEKNDKGKVGKDSAEEPEGQGEAEPERREDTFWCVLGVGKVVERAGG